MNGRRVLFTAPRTAVWDAFPLPDELQPREVLIRSDVSAVSAGTEVAVFTGTHINFTIPSATWPRYPCPTGYAMAGEVIAVGKDVREVAVGDRVASYGNHATHFLCNLERTRIFPIPDGVSLEQAVLARLADISLHAVRRAQIQFGETVAVFGQGIIGQFALQLAKLHGARAVLAIDTLDTRLNASLASGATRTLNPRRDDLAWIVAEVTDGRGLHVALEASGNPVVIPTALQLVGELGRVVLLGAPRGRVEIDPYTDIFRKGTVLIGSSEHTAPRVESPHDPWTRANNYRLCLDLVAQGRLLTDHLISHRIPSSEALALYDALADRPSEYLGVIIDWRGS